MEDYRIKLIEILKGKVTEGLNLLEGINVLDKEYSTAILNIINSDKTAIELQSQLDFEAEQLQEVNTIEKEEGEN